MFFNYLTAQFISFIIYIFQQLDGIILNIKIFILCSIQFKCNINFQKTKKSNYPVSSIGLILNCQILKIIIVK